MENSTTHDTIIEYRLDIFGDDLEEVIAGMAPELSDAMKSCIKSGQELGFVEKLSKALNDSQQEKKVSPTYFREYRARIVFMDSIDEDGTAKDSYLVRTSSLKVELKRFPDNPHLKEITSKESMNPIETISARIWSAQDTPDWHADLGLLLGVTGLEFENRMDSEAKAFSESIGV